MARLIDVQINGRTLRITCPTGAEQALAGAVERVNEEIKLIASNQKQSSSDSLSLLAAINLAGEIADYADTVKLLHEQINQLKQDLQQAGNKVDDHLLNHINQLNHKIDTALNLKSND